MKLSIVVPAAGVGRRFASWPPKQYQEVAGKTVIEWSLARLLALQPEHLLVAVSSEDTLWRGLAIFQSPPVRTVVGGASRAESVLCALNALSADVNNEHWVMVHDAARPCVRVADMRRLYQQLKDHPVGGILAVPVGDTIKYVVDSRIEKTVARESLWSALTPQIFRFGLLRDALRDGLAQGRNITDEAGALEQAGFRPEIVTGSGDNIKITRSEDLPLAEAILASQTVGLAVTGQNPEGDQ